MTEPPVAAAGWRGELAAIAGRHGLSDGAISRLAALLELIRDDPTAPTTVRDPGTGVHAHVADSLTALEAVPELGAARLVVDLGAGAGFPGLPLAIALPSARVVLLDSISRKCAFLRRAAEVAGAVNAEVACARIEDWPGRDADVVCARAVAPLAVLVEYAAPVLRLGGVLVAWKGARDAAEERAGDDASAIVGLAPARVTAVAAFPGADHRSLYVYSKLRETPSRFPRRTGMARKRPLAP